MQTIDDFLKNAWRRMAGLPEVTLKPKVIPPLESLRKTEWDKEFEQLMRNRLVMGAIRYGLLGDKSKPRYDRIGTLLRRAEEYRKTGNDELLVDIANTAMLEFVEGTHPKKHFYAHDEHNFHAKEIS